MPVVGRFHTILHSGCWMGDTKAQENAGRQGDPGSVGTPVLHWGKAGAAAVDLTFLSLSLACCFTKSVSSEIGQSYHLPATICLADITQHRADPRGALLHNGTDIEPFEVCVLSKGLIQ